MWDKSYLKGFSLYFSNSNGSTLRTNFSFTHYQFWAYNISIFSSNYEEHESTLTRPKSKVDPTYICTTILPVKCHFMLIFFQQLFVQRISTCWRKKMIYSEGQYHLHYISSSSSNTTLYGQPTITQLIIPLLPCKFFSNIVILTEYQNISVPQDLAITNRQVIKLMNMMQ